MEFIINLLSFLLTDTDIKEIKEDTSTGSVYTQEEINESNRLYDQELQENLEFLDTIKNYKK